MARDFRDDVGLENHIFYETKTEKIEHKKFARMLFCKAHHEL